MTQLNDNTLLALATHNHNHNHNHNNSHNNNNNNNNHNHTHGITRTYSYTTTHSHWLTHTYQDLLARRRVAPMPQRNVHALVEEERVCDVQVVGR